MINIYTRFQRSPKVSSVVNPQVFPDRFEKLQKQNSTQPILSPLKEHRLPNHTFVITYLDLLRFRCFTHNGYKQLVLYSAA